MLLTGPMMDFQWAMALSRVRVRAMMGPELMKAAKLEKKGLPYRPHTHSGLSETLAFELLSRHFLLLENREKKRVLTHIPQSATPKEICPSIQASMRGGLWDPGDLEDQEDQRKASLKTTGLLSREKAMVISGKDHLRCKRCGRDEKWKYRRKRK
ncbi:hypothetical protein EYF80_031342 [Liparis tanakae]|uniref:Uncharacterized protein n=1 Tax=Liparis tanakae TaxID=230148 RepID=A0A4Z2GYT2_9TELE|nr:hypothetical protein EYF80_031342 [Liparis tanakae]